MAKIINTKHHFDIPLYKGKLIIIISDNIEFVNKYVFFKKCDHHLYAHCIYDNFNGEQGFFIVLNPFSNVKLTEGVIVHEILHCVNFIMDARGQVADRNNDEADAYLAEWIGNKVFTIIKKNKVKL